MNHNTSKNTSESQNVSLQNALLLLLKTLNDSDIGYALLHPGDDALPDVSSDIDIILDSKPADSIEPALAKLNEELGTTWTQSLHYDVPQGYYYVVQVPCKSGYAYLQLDCLYDPTGTNRYHLTSQFLLDDRVFDSGYFRVAETAETLYLLIKRSLKGNASKKNVCTLAKCVSESSETLEPLIRKWLGRQLSEKIINLCNNDKTSELAELLNSSSSKIEANFALHNPVKYFSKRFTTATRQIRRFFKPTGLFIVLIGPDGCGKSTISDNVRNNMERCFRGVWRFHWRPKLLPKLGRNTTQNTESSSSEKTPPAPPAPPEKSKYNTFISLIRFTYYLADFIAGYWLIIYPKKARTTLIVGERYFADILVHPARYGFSLPAWVLRLSTYLVPKPDAIILLHGDPQKIHDRKPELPVETISDQINKYLTEMTHWGEQLVINTTEGSPEQNVNDIERQLGKVLESRLQRSTPEVNDKLIFPPVGRPRILINKSIKKEHIKKLYNPGGRFGKFFTSLMYSSPAFIRGLLSRTNTSKYFGMFPVADSEQIIKQHLQVPDASVSYYLGNGGPRSKLTAQVINNGKTIAYVKIAFTDEACKLISNESEVLEKLNDKLPKITPDNLGFITNGSWQYLFQSCPEESSPISSYKITDKIEALADKVFNINTQEMSIDQYLNKSSLENRVNDIPDFDKISADIYSCKNALKAVRKYFLDRSIITGQTHGDFTAWNIVENTDGELFIFDWEYSEPLSPAIYDLIHFRRSRLHFIDQHLPENLIAHLYKELTTKDSYLSSHASRYNISSADTPYYAIIYFIREILRHAETGDGSEYTLRKSSNQIEQINYLARCLSSLCQAIDQKAPLKKILVSAYACEADQGSEPGVGWNFVKFIGQNHHTWVITKKNNRESIEKYMSANPNLNLNFVYVGLPKWLTFWKKGQRGVRTYYYLWQFSAFLAARKLHKHVGFDLGHHVTFVNDWLWSFFALTPIPFIWGPIGSHPKIPAGLLPHSKAWFKEIVRLTIQRSMRIIDPLYWLTAIRAKRIIGINNETAKQFPLSLFSASKFIVESAIAHENTPVNTEKKQDGKTTVLYVGRFHHTKCPHLVIETFSKSLPQLEDARLVMVGRGPEENNLKILADRLGCSDTIDFIPWCTQTEVFDLMSSSTLFFFPSAEGGGMVVIEAMSYGLPVICLEYGGPGVMVPDDCGYKAPITSKQKIVENLSQAIVDYCNNDEKLERASKAAKIHALNNLSWEGKFERIFSVYEDLFASRSL